MAWVSEWKCEMARADRSCNGRVCNVDPSCQALSECHWYCSRPRQGLGRSHSMMNCHIRVAASLASASGDSLLNCSTYECWLTLHGGHIFDRAGHCERKNEGGKGEA